MTVTDKWKHLIHDIFVSFLVLENITDSRLPSNAVLPCNIPWKMRFEDVVFRIYLWREVFSHITKFSLEPNNWNVTQMTNCEIVWWGRKMNFVFLILSSPTFNDSCVPWCPSLRINFKIDSTTILRLLMIDRIMSKKITCYGTTRRISQDSWFSRQEISTKYGVQPSTYMKPESSKLCFNIVSLHASTIGLMFSVSVAQVKCGNRPLLLMSSGFFPRISSGRNFW